MKCRTPGLEGAEVGGPAGESIRDGRKFHAGVDRG